MSTSLPSTSPDELVDPLATLPGVPPEHHEAALLNPRADIGLLGKLERHLFAHRYATIGISCYGPSIDPANATVDRGEALALLEQEYHELLCSSATGALLDRLSTPAALELEDEMHKAQIRILKRDRAKLVDVPLEEQAAFTRLTTEADDVWRRAKLANDWRALNPILTA